MQHFSRKRAQIISITVSERATFSFILKPLYPALHVSDGYRAFQSDWMYTIFSEGAKS